MSTDNYFLRLPQVLEMTGIKAKSTIYKLKGEGKFPDTVKLSKRCVLWIRTDVEDWCKAQEFGQVWRAKCKKS